MKLIRFGVLVALVLPAGMIEAANSAFRPMLPPSGLYRIDRDSTLDRADHGLRQRDDGASGDAIIQMGTAGHMSAPQRWKGAGPITQCVPPAASGAIPGMGNCPNPETSTVNDSLVIRSHCATGDATLTVRRIEQDKWEFAMEFQSKASPAPSSLDWLRPHIEYVAKHGKTPQERADAAKRLAELPQVQAQAVAERAAVSEKLNAAANRAKTPEAAAENRKLATMVGNQPIPMRSTSREVWTRIADSCGTQPATR